MNKKIVALMQAAFLAMNAGVDFMPARAAEINIDDSQQLIENEIS